MELNRKWAMPSRHTFKIKPIKELVYSYIKEGDMIVDPFAGFNSPGTFTNDLNQQAPTNHHMEAIDFVRLIRDAEIDLFLFDPPYSPRQISECYKGFGLRPKTDQSFYSDVKNAAVNKIKVGGIAICCGWNSNGFGKVRGFDLVKTLLVPHGAGHNDTIVTVERKLTPPNGDLKERK